MTYLARQRTTRAIALLSALLVLAGCSSGPSSESAETAVPIATETPAGEPLETTTPSAAPTEDPTCDTIIPASTVAEFEDLGWSAREEEMRIAGTALTQGIMCTWGDPDLASDIAQVFGWAPLTEAEATTAREELLSQGWRLVDDESGDFITEDHGGVALPDADGFGTTFEFGDGWVKLADTKQSLLLIEWPPA